LCKADTAKWGDIIRINLIEELHTFRGEYTELYKTVMYVDELMHTLSYFDYVAPRHYKN